MKPHPSSAGRSRGRDGSRVRVRAAIVLALGLAPPVWALIPGIAPGLVAIFPQLLILALAMLGLVLSPRSWWRFLRYTARHPVRVLAGCAVPLVAAFLLIQVLALLAPPPRALGPMPEIPGGFPPGDRHASGSFAGSFTGGFIASAGPLARPEMIRLEDEAAFEAPGEWIEAGGKAIRIDSGKRSLTAIDPALGRAAWKATLEDPLACRPLSFERRTREGAEAGLVAITLAPSSSMEVRARLVVLDARDGSRRGAQDLPGSPGAAAIPETAAIAAAIIDERLLVVLGDALACFRLEPEGRAAPLWTRQRPRRRVVSLAGDECGRYYLLDEAELSSGGLEGGASLRLAGYVGDAPRALAVRHGLAYVLVEDGAGFRVDCLEPAFRGDPAAGSTPGSAGSPVRWSERAPAPLGPRIAIGPEGLVLTTARGIVLLDAFTGKALRETALEPGPVCPAAVTDGSAFVLLSDGGAVRIAPDGGREAWRLPEAIPGGSSMAPGDATVIPCGRSLVVEARGVARVLASPLAGAASWSHWRGGISRRGSAGDAEAPLTVKELWRRPLGDTRGGEPSRDPRAPGGSILPIPGGCLVVRPGLPGSEIRAMGRSDDDLRTEVIAGEIRGAVHHDERLFLAVEEEGGLGRVLCRRLGAAPETPRALWTASVPSLSRSAVIAAGGEIVVVASGDGLRALNARSGDALWHRPEARGGTAPIVDGESVFISSPGARGSGGELAALRAPDGSPRWTRPGRGAGWGPPTLLDEKLLAILDGRLLATGARDGSNLWEAPVPGALLESPVAASHSEIIVALEGGAALVFSPGGEARGTARLGGTSGAPRVVGLVGALVLGGSSEIGCFDTFGLESLWKVELDGRIEDLVFHEGAILALTGGALFAIGPE